MQGRSSACVSPPHPLIDHEGRMDSICASLVGAGAGGPDVWDSCGARRWLQGRPPPPVAGCARCCGVLHRPPGLCQRMPGSPPVTSRCGWCVVRGEHDHDRATVPFRLHVAADGKASKTITTYTEAIAWLAAAHLLLLRALGSGRRAGVLLHGQGRLGKSSWESALIDSQQARYSYMREADILDHAWCGDSGWEGASGRRPRPSRTH
jgi:hypothetical protein